MIWPAAFFIGFAAGLFSFYGLWLTVSKPRRLVIYIFSGSFRLTIVAGVFFFESQWGAGHVLVGLGGLQVARLCVMNRIGGLSHG